MRVVSCSCGDKFQSSWETYMANDGSLTPEQKEEFTRWLLDHGTPSHVKKMGLVEVASKGN